MQELQNTRKNIVEMLLSGDRTEREIIDKLGITRRWFISVSQSMEKEGIIQIKHTSKKTLSLKKERIKVEYIKNKFANGFFIMSGVALLALIMSFFIGNSFIYGFLLAFIVYIVIEFYTLFNTPDMKRIFLLTDEEVNRVHGKSEHSSHIL